MTTIINRSPYLDNERDFPDDLEKLSKEADRAYIETAQAVNERTIGLYPANRPAITGNAWFPTSKKLESLRQIYTFDSTANIPHLIEYTTITYMGNSFGSFTDGINWYGLPFLSDTAATGQIGFYIDSTDIIFTVDGAAPSLTNGIIVLEWISNV